MALAQIDARVTMSGEIGKLVDAVCEAFATSRSSVRERIWPLGLGEAMQWPVVGG